MKFYVFIIAIMSVILLSLSVYFLSSPFLAKDTSVYVDSFPESTGVGPGGVVSEATVTIMSASGKMYSGLPILAAPEVEEIDDGFYSVTDTPDVYDIFYNEPTSSVFVMLLQTPLSFSRAMAERKIQEMFPDQQESLCDMNIRILTNVYVDPEYAGFNLGLSFCPGSVELE